MRYGCLSCLTAAIITHAAVTICVPVIFTQSTLTDTKPEQSLHISLPVAQKNK